MFGQGCFMDEPPDPLPLLGVVLLGVVVVLGAAVVVPGVLDCCVVVLAALPEPLVAAAAPEMPATMPPAPSTPVTSTALIVFVRFIGWNLLRVGEYYASHTAPDL